MKATRVPRKPVHRIAGLLMACAVTAASLGGCTLVSQAAGSGCPESGIRLGVQPTSDPAALETAYAPLADALSQELDCSVDVQVFDSYAAEVEAMESGGLELARFSSIGYAVAVPRTQVRPVATFGMPNGNMSTYTAGIWVAADSGITGAGQLAGRTLALGAEGSTSGDTLPRKALADANVDAGEVRIRYTGGHPAALAALRDGTVDAAEIDSRTLTAAVADGSFDREAHRRIWESGVIPDDPIVVSPEVSEEFAETVQEALLSLPPEAVADVGAQSGVAAGGRMVGVDEIDYVDLSILVESLGLDEKDV
ncbi:hypothetical protein GCM10028784_37750 [Myceligenerans cantabricum]